MGKVDCVMVESDQKNSVKVHNAYQSMFHTFSTVRQIALGKCLSDRQLLVEGCQVPWDLYDAKKKTTYGIEHCQIWVNFNARTT